MLLLAGIFSSLGDALAARVWTHPPTDAVHATDVALTSDPVQEALVEEALLQEALLQEALFEEALLEEAPEPALTINIDLRDDADLFPPADDILLPGGLRIGAPDLFPRPTEIVLPGGVRIGVPAFGSDEEEEADAPEPEETRVVRARRRREPPRPPGPRLHSDPGMHSILTARRMMASGERIQGSCYRYLSTVYERAGHSSWRKRRIVYRQGRTGPYADLNLIRPGDWLYIVNDPHRTPVGTHSVMFVRWQDRARGYASVISHPGWGAPHTGRESTYDIRQTYRIIRPTM